MVPFLRKQFQKLFFKKWIIGIFRDDIKEIIRSKKFDPDIFWFFQDSVEIYYADPFIYSTDNGEIKILLEEFPFDKNYGKLSLMTIDRNYKQIGYKCILDTGSHLSYPFTFVENDITYMFPEAGQSGKLSCYKYDPLKEKVEFIQDILDLALRDSTIIKYEGKYWLFGTMTEFSKENGTKYELVVFFSDKLLGPYTAHPKNPVRTDLNGTRPAGNFIEVDGVIYRPAQNCKVQYGDSMVINKITKLNESEIEEVPDFTISINRKHRSNKGMETIHTINEKDGYIVVDGIKSRFSPIIQIKTYLRNRRLDRVKNF